MRNHPETTYFNAIGDSHRVMEVRSYDGKESLAYVDLEADGSYLILLFTPYTGGRRTHTRKSLRGAQSVLDKHMQEEAMRMVPIPATKGMWDSAIKTGYAIDFAENIEAGKEINYGSPLWHKVEAVQPALEPYMRMQFVDGGQIDIEPRCILSVR